MMKVVMYKDWGETEPIGYFFVPDNASLDWLRRNAPELLHAGQLLSGDAKTWGGDANPLGHQKGKEGVE